MTVADLASLAARKGHIWMSWPGCGEFIFWQLGVLKELSLSYNLTKVPMIGSSSGAFVTTFAACNVDVDYAAAKALKLFDEYQAWHRRIGLVGIAGEMMRAWLRDVLPEDAAEHCSGVTNLLITRWPSLTSKCISTYTSKEDLIQVVLASAHLPIVMDWNWATKCRKTTCIDGGFWYFTRRSLKHYMPPNGDRTVVVEAWRDPHMRAKWSSFQGLDRMQPMSIEGAMEMMELGQLYARQLQETDEFPLLGFPAAL